MSGLLAMLNTGGGRVEHRLIERLTGVLSVRGPDQQSTWCDGPIALGHAAFHIGSDARPQPLTLDGSAWVVADARIDDRQTLGAALGISAANVGDAELILRAFAKWDERCVDYLLGDFAFAIWIPSTRRLFCARDHFGIKPLHYVDAPGWLLVGSDVNCLRQHPAVSDVLDATAIADFLMFGHKTDDSATTFRDVRRVPPAHVLRWTPTQGCQVKRHWTLPIEAPVYRSDADCVDELRSLLRRAVNDRLRTESVGLFFSGGLDSATVAAVSLACADGTTANPVRAFSFAYDRVLPDDERSFATASARHLGIPCRFYDAADRDGQHQVERFTAPEPLALSIGVATRTRCLHDMAAHSRIAFSGEGADNALFYEWRPYLRYLYATKQFGRIALDAITYLRQRRRLPLALGSRDALSPEPAAIVSKIPPWMSPELVHASDLEGRWRFVMRPAVSDHPTRPAGYFSFALPLWHTVFDAWDPSYTGVPLEVSHPFLDLRVVRFLLTLAPIPWCREKHVLRSGFRDELPPTIRVRPKTPLRESFEAAEIRRNGPPAIVRSPRLSTYVSMDRLDGSAIRSASDAEALMNLSIFSRWLAGLDSIEQTTASAGTLRAGR